MPEVKNVGDAYAWIEQECSIHLKASSREGDPLELTAGEARELAQVLLALATELDAFDEQ